VQQKEGFCLVTGEPGTGKTTILNVFKESHRDKAEIALVLTPRLSPEEFLLSVLEDLNVKLTTTNKNDILKAFRDFLVEKSQIGKPVIIIVDEAQNLPDETLEELRLLSNLETYKDKLLQIILIAQPELDKRLNKDKLRQLSQRITVRARLTPLQSDETLEYINYRLIKAGKGFLRLDGGLSRPIYKFSAGIPRIINILASRAIMSAYLEESNTITPRHLRYAIRHLKGGVMDKEIKKRPVLIYALIVLVIIAGAMGYYWTSDYFTGDKGTPPVAIKKPISPLRYAVVSAEAANIMAEPDISASKIGMIYKGEKIKIIDETMDSVGSRWYKLSVYGDREGWIADKDVEVNGVRS